MVRASVKISQTDARIWARGPSRIYVEVLSPVVSDKWQINFNDIKFEYRFILKGLVKIFRVHPRGMNVFLVEIIGSLDTTQTENFFSRARSNTFLATMSASPQHPLVHMIMIQHPSIAETLTRNTETEDYFLR